MRIRPLCEYKQTSSRPNPIPAGKCGGAARGTDGLGSALSAQSGSDIAHGIDLQDRSVVETLPQNSRDELQRASAASGSLKACWRRLLVMMTGSLN